MHELSIAMSIVDMAQEEAERRGVHVSAIHLKLGLLSGVVKDALLSSYEMACMDTPLAGSHLVIEEIPIVVFSVKEGGNFAKVIRGEGKYTIVTDK